MKWENPPVIKIYEAIGAIVDGRIQIINENEAKVYSSSKNKHYMVTYSPKEKAIMANDNGSYWQNYLGYPSIAFLIEKRLLSYDPELGELLKNIPWKDINQKYKNDFEKTLKHILEPIGKDQREALSKLINQINKEIKELNLSLLGKKLKPPIGY